jgi:hypothetical protein
MFSTIVGAGSSEPELSEAELSELELSEPPELHHVTAPAPTKRCGSLRLRLPKTGVYTNLQVYNCFIIEIKLSNFI